MKVAAVISGVLYTEDDFNGARVGSAEWSAWLALGLTFYFEGDCGFTVRAEKRRNGLSWYGFKKIDGKLTKKYVGRLAGMSAARLHEVGSAFCSLLLAA